MKENIYYPTRCDAITNIISSVAAEQNGLANILEVEAEKIKAIISVSENPVEMLEANRSVETMINSITRLELILSSKLDLFRNCLCVGCTDVKVGYAVIDMIVEDETGGIIEKDEDKTTFRYTHGTSGTIIRMITDPVVDVYLKGVLPEGWIFRDNRLVIPDEVDWSRNYYITFTVGNGDNSYDIDFISLV